MLEITLVAIVLLSGATYRISRLLIEDVIFSTPRDALFNRFPPESNKFTYLLTCYWCISMWIATILVVCYILLPVATVVGALVLTLSAITGLLSER